MPRFIDTNSRVLDLGANWIAIDEIYVGKKNKVFTIVIDWITGAIVFVCRMSSFEQTPAILGTSERDPTIG